MIEKVLTYMQTLSERERSILTLRIWDDLSYEEISKITGESVANSKKIVSRTLEKISANVHQFIILTYLFTYVISR
jgi:RNA polymerase sigma factor (sigma-70 family)